MSRSPRTAPTFSAHQTRYRPSSRSTWQIHKAHCDYQQAAEDRRQLAADIGEITRTFLDELVAAGWSETEARDANIRELAASHRRV
jgi:hypothetical protein